MLNKKGQVLPAIVEGGNAFVYIGLFLVMIALVLALGSKVVSDQRSDAAKDYCLSNTNGFTVFNATSLNCQNSTGAIKTDRGSGYNITTAGLQSMADVGDEQSTFSSVGVIGVVIALLLAVFGGILLGRRQ